MTASILALILGIFLSCIFIDKIRIGLFKLLKIEKLSAFLGGLISKKTTRGCLTKSRTKEKEKN